MIDNNFLNTELGFEYGISEKLRASAGWVATQQCNENYQNDQRYSTTPTLRAGFGFRISPMIILTLGQYTFYQEGSKDYNTCLELFLSCYGDI